MTYNIATNYQSNGKTRETSYSKHRKQQYLASRQESLRKREYEKYSKYNNYDDDSCFCCGLKNSSKNGNSTYECNGMKFYSLCDDTEGLDEFMSYMSQAANEYYSGGYDDYSSCGCCCDSYDSWDNGWGYSVPSFEDKLGENSSGWWGCGW